MKDYLNLVIEPLQSNHDRGNFFCGIEKLDSYLKKQAGQDIKRNISRVFVATNTEKSVQILGYYTLSSLSIALQELPAGLSKKLPKHPVPAALIGRLAVSKHVQGYGIGRMLLTDALKRTLAVREQIAVYALVVDALNDRSANFYKQFGFIPLAKDNSRLFLPLRSDPFKLK
jgi:ribosomal protein S18 acetylase RimI-like enzyme